MFTVSSTGMLMYRSLMSRVISRWLQLILNFVSSLTRAVELVVV